MFILFCNESNQIQEQVRAFFLFFIFAELAQRKVETNMPGMDPRQGLWVQELLQPPVIPQFVHSWPGLFVKRVRWIGEILVITVVES